MVDMGVLTWEHWLEEAGMMRHRERRDHVHTGGAEVLSEEKAD
jgi:hypothetical protein